MGPKGPVSHDSREKAPTCLRGFCTWWLAGCWRRSSLHSPCKWRPSLTLMIHSTLQTKPVFSLLRTPFHHFCIRLRFTLHRKSLPMIHLLGVPGGSARPNCLSRLSFSTHVAEVSCVDGRLSLGSSHLWPAHRNLLLRRCSLTCCSRPMTRPGLLQVFSAMTGVVATSSDTPGSPPAADG